jgi:hypothetical protein
MSGTQAFEFHHEAAGDIGQKPHCRPGSAFARTWLFFAVMGTREKPKNRYSFDTAGSKTNPRRRVAEKILYLSLFFDIIPSCASEKCRNMKHLL